MSYNDIVDTIGEVWAFIREHNDHGLKDKLTKKYYEDNNDIFAMNNSLTILINKYAQNIDQYVLFHKLPEERLIKMIDNLSNALNIEIIEKDGV